PNGPDWIHEIKHDGFRVLAQRAGSKVQLISRNGHDLTYRFPQRLRGKKGFTTAMALCRWVARPNMSIWQDEKAERNRQSLARLTKALHAFSLRLFYLGRSGARSCR